MAVIEIRHRRDGATVELAPDQVVDYLLRRIAEADSSMVRE